MVPHEVGALCVVILGHYLWCGSNMQHASLRLRCLFLVFLSNVMIQIILLVDIAYLP